jgi:hypothetical protein
MASDTMRNFVYCSRFCGAGHWCLRNGGDQDGREATILVEKIRQSNEHGKETQTTGWSGAEGSAEGKELN